MKKHIYIHLNTKLTYERTSVAQARCIKTEYDHICM